MELWHLVINTTTRIATPRNKVGALRLFHFQITNGGYWWNIKWAVNRSDVMTVLCCKYLQKYWHKSLKHLNYCHFFMKLITINWLYQLTHSAINWYILSTITLKSIHTDVNSNWCLFNIDVYSYWRRFILMSIQSWLPD